MNRMFSGLTITTVLGALIPLPAVAFTPAESNFLNWVVDGLNRNGMGLPDTSDRTVSNLLQVGYGVCNDLDRGVVLEDIVSEAISTANSMGATVVAQYQFGFVMGMAIHALCPQHQDQYSRVLNQYGNAAQGNFPVVQPSFPNGGYSGVSPMSDEAHYNWEECGNWAGC